MPRAGGTFAALTVWIAIGPVALVAASAATTGTPAGALPGFDCVAAVREARLARERGDATTARRQLEAAADLPSCELPALSGLLQLVRETPDTPEREAALRQRLSARIGDPASELPPGLLTQLEMIGGTEGDREGETLLLDALERRLTAGSAAGRELPSGELVEVLTVIASLQVRLDRDEAARETMARLLVLAPNDNLRWRALMFDLEHDRWQSAAELLVAMRADPEAPDVLRSIHVRVLAHLGRYDEMLRELDRLAPPPGPPAVTDVAPLPATSGVSPQLGDYAWLLVEAAWALRDAGRDAEAAGLFRRVLAYDPEQAEAQAALLHLYGSAEERAAAAAATASRRQAESDPSRLFEEGTDLLGAGDAAGAFALLARAAPELGGSGYAEPAWYNLGTAAVKLERWDEAARAFEQAIAVNPDRVESHYKRGVSLFHLARWTEAARSLRRTLELQPDKRDAHHYLAGCYAKLGDTEAAARELALFNAPR